MHKFLQISDKFNGMFDFTMQGNLNWMRSRESSMKSAVWHGREDEIRPYGNPRASDSANLDAVAEVQVYNLDSHCL